MLTNLSQPNPLRGCLFEHVGRILLRREKQHNYIFATRQFDSFNQIIERYNLTVISLSKHKCDFIENGIHRFDLLEFILDSEKNIIDLVVYDVKTKHHYIKKSYFEFCQSNKQFMDTASQKYEIKAYVISMVLFENWKCSFNIYDYNKIKVHTYKYRPRKIIQKKKMKNQSQSNIL